MLSFETFVQALSVRYDTMEARSIARIVFADALGYRTPPSGPLSAEDIAKLAPLQARLLAGEPVQYVLGKADFFGLKIKVSPAVLIPRQETEELVAWALGWLNACEKPHPVALDIGLGSGCIGIALRYRHSDLKLMGIEKSPDALEMATQNATRILGEGNFTFLQGDILRPESLPADLPHFDLIISNPPYIPREEHHWMPEHVWAHEPHEALFVEDDDPLCFYRSIARFALQKLVPGGALFFECNEFNARQVAALLESMGFSSVLLRQDLCGADRMVRALKPG